MGACRAPARPPGAAEGAGPGGPDLHPTDQGGPLSSQIPSSCEPSTFHPSFILGPFNKFSITPFVEGWALPCPGVPAPRG